MKLLPLSTEQALECCPVWFPHLQRVAHKRNVSVAFLIKEVADGLTQVCLLWDDETEQATGALGVKIALKNGERIGDLHWIAGGSKPAILALMPEIENFLQSYHGCVAVDVTGRNSLARVLRSHGYTQTQVTLSKRLS